VKIDLLCSDGSPIGVTYLDLWGKGQKGIGVGGSEYGLLTLCQAWHEAGHEVTLYNTPLGHGSPFAQKPVGAFNPDEERDVIIVFRSPNERGIIAKGLRVWLSCDQYTRGSFRDFAPSMDKIVTISPFHSNYFEKTYGIKNSIHIDLPIRTQDFEDKEVEKVPFRLIFTSVPDRGLDLLHPMWKEIKMNFPEASLVITSDYRLWGADSPLNERHRLMWLKEIDVHFSGAILREQLIQEQLKAQLLIYPNIYDELFCVAVAEAQVAGVYPVTSTIGALATTNMGTLVAGNPRDGKFRKGFLTNVCSLLGNPVELAHKQEEVKKKAIERFNPKKILELWDEKIFS
jgi:glycosyltransferase involved in cell wall biosynthesis